MGKINFSAVLKGVVKVVSTIVSSKQVSDIVIPELQKKIDRQESKKENQRAVTEAMLRQGERDSDIQEIEKEMKETGRTFMEVVQGRLQRKIDGDTTKYY